MTPYAYEIYIEKETGIVQDVFSEKNRKHSQTRARDEYKWNEVSEMWIKLFPAYQKSEDSSTEYVIHKERIFVCTVPC